MKAISQAPRIGIALVAVLIALAWLNAVTAGPNALGKFNYAPMTAAMILTVFGVLTLKGHRWSERIFVVFLLLATLMQYWKIKTLVAFGAPASLIAFRVGDALLYTIIVSYFLFSGRMRAHVRGEAQQGTPADPPRPAGSAGG